MTALVLAIGVGIKVFSMVYMIYALHWYSKETKSYTKYRIEKAKSMNLNFALRHLINTQDIYHAHMRVFSMMYILGTALYILPESLEGKMSSENFWFGILVLCYVIMLIFNLLVDRRSTIYLMDPDVSPERKIFWKKVKNINFWVFWLFMFIMIAYTALVM